MNSKSIFEQLINRSNLSVKQMETFLEDCMSGKLSDCQIASFLALMRMKGETTEELITAAKVMKAHAKHIDLGSNLIDIVGTGGDSKGSFNISTATSFVVSAAGVKVAKHGNRSVSSNSGSADLLEKAGFELYIDEQSLKACINEFNLAFLFAPQFHPAMKYAREARKELGIRTLFNLLGPLLNPAGVKRQVIGVYPSHWLEPISKVLVELGAERLLVLSSQDGMDEISIAAKTDVIEYQFDKFIKWTIDPKDYNMRHDSLNDIIVSSPEESLNIILEVFNGKKGAARDIVLLNAAAAIYCASDGSSFEEAINLAKNAIDSGKAKINFEKLQQLTQNSSNE